jgi:hypothetical protein
LEWFFTKKSSENDEEKSFFSRVIRSRERVLEGATRNENALITNNSLKSPPNCAPQQAVVLNTKQLRLHDSMAGSSTALRLRGLSEVHGDGRWTGKLFCWYSTLFIDAVQKLC